jgi:hypothetical protein
MESTSIWQNTQYVEEAEDIPSFSPKDVNRLQQLGGPLLYYARAVGPTLIMAVNILASEQTRATAGTAEKISNCSIIAQRIRMPHCLTMHQT